MSDLINVDAVVMDDSLLLHAYELMRHARALDVATVAWQRQGLVPAFPPLRGQEAAQVGAALAVDLNRDMLFPTYREHAAALTAGVDLGGYYASHINQWHGGLYNPVASHFAPLQAVVAGSVLHAVGWALGKRKDGEDAVAVAFFGDGASSEGDVHEAMNFAAVLSAPVVFFVQNNRWALSVPLDREVAGGSVSARAGGYGIPGLACDGDDVEEVYRNVHAAVDHARITGGPVVVEAFTYRRGPHATSDDPSRYRSLEQEREAGPDPIARVAETLRARQALPDGWEDEANTRIELSIGKLHEHLLDPAATPGEDIFRYVFQETTPQLVDQRTQWSHENELAEEEDHRV